nr:uracil-DNA glycosylase [Ferrimicrobium acidiphilum]
MPSTEPDSLAVIGSEVTSCTRCRLCATRTNAVPGEGRADATVVIVGEAPGDKEDRTGRPFQGDAGSNLNGLLERAAINREEAFVTNVVKCRPVDNNRNRKPTSEEINACLPYIKRQLQLIKPNIVVLLGASALNAFFPDKKIREAHGKVLALEGQQFFITYHPAAKIYDKALGPIMDTDFDALGKRYTV